MESLPIDAETVNAFLLVLARTSAWVVTAPVISAKGVSRIGRTAVAFSLALFVASTLPLGGAPEGTGGYVAAVGIQVFVGLSLGLLTQLLFTAFEVAGTFLDTSGGFSAAAIVDPLSGQQAAVFSRMFSLVFGALFFATQGYAEVIGGFVRSFRAIPLGAVPTLSPDAASLLGSAATQIVASALQIGAPLLGVLFLVDVALGIAGRLVPQAGTLSLALPVKGLVALSMAGLALALLPGQAAQLIDPAVRLPYQVLHT